VVDALLGTASNAQQLKAVLEGMQTLVVFISGGFILLAIMLVIVLYQVEKIKRQLEDRDLVHKAQLSKQTN